MAMTSSPTEAYEETFGIAPHVYHRRWLILSVLALSLITVVTAVSSLNVALPTLARDLDASSSDLQWILDAYALVFAGFLLPAGALGDRFGRRGALQVGLVIFGLAALVASQSTTPDQVIATRAVMGIGAALIMPATLSIILTSFPMHERPKAIAIWAGCAGLGGALGPISSGLLLEHFSWGSVFFINIPLVVLLLVLSVIVLPSSKDPGAHPLDPPGAVLSVIGLVALVYAVIEGPPKGWTSPVVLGSFALAAVALTAFVLVELRRRDPMLDPRLFKVKGFRAGSMAVTAAFFCMFGMFFLITQYLQFVKGYTPLQAGIRVVPSALCLLLVSPQSPRLVGRFGVRNVVTTGFVLVSIGLALMSTYRADTPYIEVALGLVLMASGLAMVMPPSSQLIVGSLPLHKAGVGSAVNDVTREVGGALGIAVLGSILSSGYRQAVEDDVAGLPPAAAAAATDSIQGAMGVASGIGERGGALLASASDAFTSATTVAFASASLFVLVVGVAIARSMPNAVPTRQVPPEVSELDEIVDECVPIDSAAAPIP